MKPLSIDIPLEAPPGEGVSGLFWKPGASPSRDSALLLANGAGLPMDSPFMAALARGLAARGFPLLQFDYLYQERTRRDGRRRPPDGRARLEHVHERALAVLVERVPRLRVLLCGKSMGGRMGSHLAAKGERCAGLVFFGYPLHPPGKPEKLRAEHFAAIAQPALFLQGTRDKLCNLELLDQALTHYGGRATVAVIEGADHGFHVLRSSGRSADEVLESLLDLVADWEGATFPA